MFVEYIGVRTVVRTQVRDSCEDWKWAGTSGESLSTKSWWS